MGPLSVCALRGRKRGRLERVPGAAYSDRGRVAGRAHLILQRPRGRAASGSPSAHPAPNKRRNIYRTLESALMSEEFEDVAVAKNSKIEWTTHTFNPWWGCVKVSPACKNCYAEAWAKRVGSKVWGARAERRFFSDKHWSEPRRWNVAAAAASERPRVFCASMADVFEDRRDLDVWRTQLWTLIDDTPHLDWLLLTKRPELIKDLAPWKSEWPRNIWLGTTVEDQLRAEERLPHLALINAHVKFISAEPLLGPIDITPWLGGSIDWVITGGESGVKARPSSPSWFRSLLNQCMEAEIPFHFKQWGDWAPGQGINLARLRAAEVSDGTTMVRIGKKNAGRSLDGETWDGLPLVATI